MSNARRRWDRFKRSEFAKDLKVFSWGIVIFGPIAAADLYAQTH